jgi:hypothetical protein
MEAYATEVGGEVMTWEEMEKRAMPRLVTKVFDELRGE